MKQNYLSANKLSIWIRLSKKWIRLYTELIEASDKLKFKRLAKLSELLGVKKKLVLTASAGFFAVCANAQTGFEQVTNRSEQTFKTPINSTLFSDPEFADIDGDGDLDLVLSGYEQETQYFRNDDGDFNLLSVLDSPFPSILPSTRQSTALGDIDNDGDLDLLVAQSGNFSYYVQNNGVFELQPEAQNPFSSFNHGIYASPSFADVDGDGDLDLVIGTSNGNLVYYEYAESGLIAIGGMVNKTFNLTTGTDNPFNSIDVGNQASPALIDLDDDNDLDVVIGDGNGEFTYLQNDNGVFNRQLGMLNPFDGIKVGYNSRPTFVDIDNDGDLDLVSGEYYSTLKVYENQNSSFSEITADENPFNGYEIGPFPKFADLDGNGTDELVSGQFNSKLKYFKKENGVFVEKINADNPFNGINLAQSTPDFGDFDQDNDLDLIVGTSSTNVIYYTQENLVFTNDSKGSPFREVRDLHPAFIDADGDGDLDVVNGDLDGIFAYHENDGGVLTQVLTTADNPFSSISGLDGAPRPTAVDLDGDSDMDLVFAKPDGSVGYLENVNGVFTEKTGTDNPFNSINTDLKLDDKSDVTLKFSVTFSDLDGDGDLDMLMGDRGGSHLEFRNTLIVNGIFSKKVNKPLEIYPNPATSVISTELGELKILDAIGNLVLSQNSNGKVDVSSLESGVYIVTQNGKKTKLIIE